MGMAAQPSAAQVISGIGTEAEPRLESDQVLAAPAELLGAAADLSETAPLLRGVGDTISPLITKATGNRPLLVSDLQATLLAKAKPDECFDGIGNPYPPGPPCEQGSPKVNQAYLWGMTKHKNTLWFGTGANMSCIAVGQLFNDPDSNSTNVCEYGDSQLAQNFGFPPFVGDFRVSQIYSYDTKLKLLINRSPVWDPNFIGTLGMRSAGTVGNVILMGGPALDPNGSINIMAFRADIGLYIGSKKLTEYGNIRKWTEANGHHYSSVLKVGGGGAVLRWRGNVTNPHQYQKIVDLDTEGANLVPCNGRLFVSTWPSGNPNNPSAGLYMSPPIPSGGLTPAHASQWKKVFSYDQYDPDPLVRKTLAGGALACFDGYLYWGTMQLPGSGFVLFSQQFGDDVDDALENTLRPASIFRSKTLHESNPQIDLLYGFSEIPVYNPGTQVWEPKPTGFTPLNAPISGVPSGGFYNFRNLYTWTMKVFQNKLYVGLMEVPQSIRNSTPHCRTNQGGDLYRFSPGQTTAEAVSLDGIGTCANFGFRTMVSDDALYIGTATHANLSTNPNDTRPDGGLELISIKPQ
jgi:hypothetical protein